MRIDRALTVALLACAVCGVAAGTASADALSGSNAVGAKALIPVRGGAQHTVTTATPLAATNTFSDCQNTGYHLCLWRDAGYSGSLWEYDIWHWSQNNWHFVGGPENDQASSGYNHRVNATLLGKDYPPSYPDIVCFPPGDAVNNFANYDWPDGSGFNDSVSAFDLLSTSSC